MPCLPRTPYGADSLGALSGAIEADTAFSADSITGGLIRGAYGDESMGGWVDPSPRRWAAVSPAGSRVNLNPATQALNLTDTVGGWGT
ncbi:MAG: hypothetical protein ACKV2T_36765 [Kofleriaceae bacterium]